MSKWDKLASASSGAALTEAKGKAAAGTKKKSITVPLAYEDAWKKLKTDGGTGLDFTSYIIEALREKLDRDNAL